jgi:hypothetical protein
MLCRQGSPRWRCFTGRKFSPFVEGLRDGIKLKIAKQIALMIPQNVLAHANKVIK